MRQPNNKRHGTCHNPSSQHQKSPTAPGVQGSGSCSDVSYFDFSAAAARSTVTSASRATIALEGVPNSWHRRCGHEPRPGMNHDPHCGAHPRAHHAATRPGKAATQSTDPAPTDTPETVRRVLTAEVDVPREHPQSRTRSAASTSTAWTGTSRANPSSFTPTPKPITEVRVCRSVKPLRPRSSPNASASVPDSRMSRSRRSNSSPLPHEIRTDGER